MAYKNIKQYKRPTKRYFTPPKAKVNKCILGHVQKVDRLVVACTDKCNVFY